MSAKPEGVIVISLEDALTRRYDIRKAHSGKTLEATLPREVIEREAKRLGIEVKDFIATYEIEWLYNDFRGLHARFVPRE